MAILPHHELELRFIFRPREEGTIMDNNTIHELRRGVAETLELLNGEQQDLKIGGLFLQ